MFATAAFCLAAEDGRRAVDVSQFGVAVRAPLAWRPIRWAQGDVAFELRVPQEEESPPGSVTCRLELAAGTLADWRQRQIQPQVAAGHKSRLVVDGQENLDPQRFASLIEQQIGECWVMSREHDDLAGRRFFERTCAVGHGDLIYVFSLQTDEAHHEAYRADFEELIASARFQQPTSGVARIDRQVWVQRDYRFALWLPTGFRPSFAPRGKFLLISERPANAEQQPADDSAAELAVLAGGQAPLDLAALAARLPGEIRTADPQAAVARCQVVPQGPQGRALEVVVHTDRSDRKITVISRWFRGEMRNYELRGTCPTGEYEEFAKRLARSADSFRELPPPPATDAL